MKICPYCGATHKDEAQFCARCGKRLEPPSPEPGYEYDDSEPTGSLEPIDDYGSWAEPASGPDAMQETTIINRVVPASSQPRQQKLEPARGLVDPVKRSIETKALWTPLKKGDKRQQFFLEDREACTEHEYMGKLSTRLAQNGVPASIEMTPIRWDASEFSYDAYVVHTRTVETNPLTCLVKFAKVGKFYFVEQKTFLTPPELPPVPDKKRDVPDTSATLMQILMGLGLSLGGFGVMNSCSPQGYGSYGSYSYDYAYRASSSSSGGAMLSLILIVIGVGILLTGLGRRSAAKAAKEHNDKVDKQILAWNKAWDEWEQTSMNHAYDETINGQVTRVYLAVFDTMRQVNEDIFQQTSLEEKSEDTSLAQMSDVISRRRESLR